MHSYIQTQGNIHTYKHTQIITPAHIYTYLHTHRKLYIHRCVWILQLNQRLCNFLFSFCKSNCNPFSLLFTPKCKLFSLLDPVTHSFFFLLIRTNQRCSFFSSSSCLFCLKETRWRITHRTLIAIILLSSGVFFFQRNYIFIL